MIQISRPSLDHEEEAAVQAVLRSGWLGLGTVAREFEADLERHLGSAHVIACNSGTAALHLALAGLGIGSGDEVIVPSLTFAASVQAILAAGATPVFCEAREDTLLIDADDVASRITARTRAVMPAHLWGSACDMDALLDLASRRGIRVVEDAAHAFGASYKTRRLGSFGHATCFSFGPVKNITCGEGGAVAVADSALATDIRRLRSLGFSGIALPEPGDLTLPQPVTSQGFRYHMPDFCAAIGRVQLTKLAAFLERRRAISARYDKAFRTLPAIQLRVVEQHEAAPHIYVVRVPSRSREAFRRRLAEYSVASGVHYPANHQQPYFRQFVREPLPRTDRLCQETVTLPLHCELTDADVDKVIEAVIGASALVEPDRR